MLVGLVGRNVTTLASSLDPKIVSLRRFDVYPAIKRSFSLFLAYRGPFPPLPESELLPVTLHQVSYTHPQLRVPVGTNLPRNVRPEDGVVAILGDTGTSWALFHHHDCLGW